MKKMMIMVVMVVGMLVGAFAMEPVITIGKLELGYFYAPNSRMETTYKLDTYTLKESFVIGWKATDQVTIRFGYDAGTFKESFSSAIVDFAKPDLELYSLSVKITY